MSMLEDSIATSARMTPTKFSISHVYGIVSNYVVYLSEFAMRDFIKTFYV